MLENAVTTRMTESAVVVIGSRREDYDAVGGILPQKGVIRRASAIARGALRVFQRQLNNTIGHILQCAAPYPHRGLTSRERSWIGISNRTAGTLVNRRRGEASAT